jgi:molecular chaperone GrpE
MSGKEPEKTDAREERMTDRNTDTDTGAEARATAKPLDLDDMVQADDPADEELPTDAADTTAAAGGEPSGAAAEGNDAMPDLGIGGQDEAIDPLQVLRDELAVLRQELVGARAEAAALKDQLLRALAEGENQRRRHLRDKEETKKYGSAVLAKDLLSVSDNLERALANIPQEALDSDPHLKTLHEGVSATERELKAALDRHQVRKIEPLGEKFDSNFHQAMFEVESADHAPGTVAQVLQPGYVMHGERLLRPALVAVARAPSAAEPANDENAGGNGGR